MKSTKDVLLGRVETLIAQGEQVLSTTSHNGFSNVVDSGALAGFKTSALSFVLAVYGREHPYYTEIDSKIKDSYDYMAKQGVEILKSVKQEIENDWHLHFEQIISADIFSDFLEMASHLLENKYKDAAAVMIGSTLEEHLRFLCKARGVDVVFLDKDSNEKPKKSDKINADLKIAGAYNSFEQKQITAWLDIRNDAAHGNYAKYDLSKVGMMLQGVQHFMQTHQS